MATAVDDYKNKYTAYPPNCQSDGTGPIDENGVLTDVRRHIKQLAPRSQESDDMAFALTGQTCQLGGTEFHFSGSLAGGITARRSGRVLAGWF